MAIAAEVRASDDVIIRRALREPEAFTELFDRYADGVHRYAVRRLGPDAAEDVVAETFAVAFAARRRFDLSWTDARPWLFGIATNLIRTHRRTERRRWRGMASAVAAADEEPHADRVAARVTAAAARVPLATALVRLSADQRDALLLYAWAELDYGQIAEALGIPIGTVRSRLHRARAVLREALATAGLHVDAEEEEGWTS